MLHATSQLTRLLALPLALSMWYLPGCGTRGRANAIGILPPPVPGAALSQYEPPSPMAPVVAGMVGRTLGRTGTSNGYHIEAREFIVGPGARKVDVPLKAAGIFEVTSGSGTLTIGSQRRDLAPGATFATPDDQPLTIENTAPTAIHLRAYMFIAE